MGREVEMRNLLVLVGVMVVAYALGQHLPSGWIDAALTWGAGALHLSVDPFLVG